MVDIKEILKEKIKAIISEWTEEDIYAVSFFVYSNEAFEYGGFSNVTELQVGYNTEAACGEADEYSEERWNYAFWLQNDVPVISCSEDTPETKALFEWYRENGITNIGYEDPECYDAEMQYIGKGPVGQYELMNILAEIAAELQDSGYIMSAIGRSVPVIIHGLEYAWYEIEATKKANPGGEADVFLEAMEEFGFI